MPEMLSSPAVSAGGSERAGRQVEPSASGSDLAATGTGLPSGVPVPVAASLDVPVGRRDPVSPDTGVPPQEADRPGPRMWVLADEPGPEVTHVVDAEGDVWERRMSAIDSCDWACCPDGIRVSWSQLLVEFGPLTDATPGTGPAEPEATT